ncbi:MAG: DNA polymerase III subunit gamma/tau [Clostridiales bacterium]|nr:DNA polymerase III subunit gamma/tau [Clostridiales bacterium]
MYKALYRKWRPLTFDDVISQPHITTTLQNQIKNNKTAHAYLFTGSRGTGKTTCARIFAKAVNCVNQVDGNPCLECDICKDAEAFALSDIIEIDAASNNSVDDVRDLRNGAVYTPERCKYKIYIIDEVHMLSPSAFNALLKIMEEPPYYVKFILATTELHKVPATITSRCQRFDFRRITVEDILKRLLYIAKEENIVLDEKAAAMIATHADGGMRDALSLLDQCTAFSYNITEETVSAAAGVAGRGSLFDILDAVIDENPSVAIEIVNNLYAMSKDMQRLCDELILQFRNLMLLKVNPNQTDVVNCMPDELDRLAEMAERLELKSILDYLSILQSCNERLARAVNKRVELEMGIIKLCLGKNNRNIEKSLDNSDIYDKIKKLEEKISANAQRSPSLYSDEKSDIKKSPAERLQEQPVDISKLRPEDFEVVKNWSEVLKEFQLVSPAVSASLTGSTAFTNGNLLLINAKNKFFLTLFKNKENALSLGECVKKVLGRQYIIRAKCVSDEAESNKAMDLLKKAEDLKIDTSVD